MNLVPSIEKREFFHTQQGLRCAFRGDFVVKITLKINGNKTTLKVTYKESGKPACARPVMPVCKDVVEIFWRWPTATMAGRQPGSATRAPLATARG
jgi:hypothetical protein